MFLSRKLKERFHSLQEELTTSVRSLSASASSSSGLNEVLSSSLSSSPQYHPQKKLSLHAGQELLEIYQDQWEELHVANERNADLATRCDRLVGSLHQEYEAKWEDTMTLQMLVTQIPKINEDMQGIMRTLGDLESLFSDVEVALLALEDTIDARQQQERQLDQRFQTAMYQERRKAEFTALANRLQADYEKKKREVELANLINSRQKQSVYGQRFKEDVAKYAAGAGANGPNGHNGSGLLKVPGRSGRHHDNSLETVDLDADDADDAGLEAFLRDDNDGDILDDDILGELSPLPKDDDDKGKMSAAGDTLDSLVAQTSELSVNEPSVSLATGEMSRAESMYYTPDTTMEKLDVNKEAVGGLRED